jgi:23S rRNA (guanosine2251-2'-O)-methyltransferase
MRQTISGFHAIEEALKGEKIDGTLLFSKESERISRIAALAKKRGCAVKKVHRRELEETAASPKARDLLLIVEKKGDAPAEADLNDFIDRRNGKSLVVLLDGITDPQNLGAVLRSCDLFAVDLVVIPSRRSAQVNETVRRTSSGAASYVPVAVENNLRRAVSRLKEAGYWIFAADVQGEAPWKLDLRGKIAYVFGSEEKGTRRIVRKECDGLISIPTTGHIDSLNVSVAAGILLYEFVRQNG